MERLTERFKDGGAFILPSVVSQLSPMKSEIIEKLADYEDAEEQGLLLRLPCKVGDTVYIVDEISNEFTGIDETKISKIIHNGVFLSFIFDRDSYGYSEGHFGKTVFLTKEEAEKALADMASKYGMSVYHNL